MAARSSALLLCRVFWARSEIVVLSDTLAMLARDMWFSHLLWPLSDMMSRSIFVVRSGWMARSCFLVCSIALAMLAHKSWFPHFFWPCSFRPLGSLSPFKARSSKLVRSCHVAMLVRGQWFSLLPWPCSLIQFGSLRFIGHARSVLLVLSQLLARSGPMILLLVHDSFLSRVSISIFMARSGHVVLSVNLARSEPLVLSQAMTRTSVQVCGRDPHAP